MELSIPRDRNFRVQTVLLDAFKRNSPEFEAKIMALYARGATTKDIADFMEPSESGMLTHYELSLRARNGE